MGGEIMKKKMTVLTGLLMAVAITAYSVSGTYAKYTSTFTGTSKATVAKWAFDVNGQTDATQEFTFNLFNTIFDSNGTDAETDVAPGTADQKIIAPGTRGKFSVAVANNSEVTADVTLAGTVTTKTADGNPITYTTTVTGDDGSESTVTNTAEIPLKFSTDGTTWTDFATVLGTISQRLAIGASITTTEVQWKWDFDENDARDTALGLAAAKGTLEAVVELKVTATQVD